MTQRDRRVYAGSGDDRSFVALLDSTVVGIACRRSATNWVAFHATASEVEEERTAGHLLLGEGGASAHPLDRLRAVGLDENQQRRRSKRRAP
jgi:hypothetical protein